MSVEVCGVRYAVRTYLEILLCWDSYLAAPGAFGNQRYQVKKLNSRNSLHL